MEEERSFATRALSIIGFGLLAFAITILAGGIWSALLVANLRSSPAVPWSVPAMALLLWLMWGYLGGKGWPRSTSDVRRQYLRATEFCSDVPVVIRGRYSIRGCAGWILDRAVPIGQNASQRAPRCVELSPHDRRPHDSDGVVGCAIHGGGWVSRVFSGREFRGSIAVTVSSLGFAFAHFPHGILWPKLLVYFLVGIAFGATAYLTNSTLPAIVPHIIGDLTFFTLVWPNDAARRLVWDSGPDNWFWIHVAQAIICWQSGYFGRLGKGDASLLPGCPS